MISAIKYSHVKNPRDANSPTKYVMFDLEDVEGSIRCILWPQDFAQHGHLVAADGVVVLQGRLDYRGGDDPNLIVDKVIPVDVATVIPRALILALIFRIVWPSHDGHRRIEWAAKTRHGTCLVVQGDGSGTEERGENELLATHGCDVTSRQRAVLSRAEKVLLLALAAVDADELLVVG